MTAFAHRDPQGRSELSPHWAVHTGSCPFKTWCFSPELELPMEGLEIYAREQHPGSWWDHGWVLVLNCHRQSRRLAGEGMSPM